MVSFYFFSCSNYFCLEMINCKSARNMFTAVYQDKKNVFIFFYQNNINKV